MRLHVKLFAVARELAGRDTLEIELPPGATVADLRAHIESEYPSLADVVPHALWAVNTQYAAADTQLTEQSDVALIPPVSGG
jgi:molybdopterin converting factor subunit 1